MRITNLKYSAWVVMMVLFSSLVTARQPDQKNDSQDCSFAVYSSKEVDRRVRVLSRPEPLYNKEDLRKSAPGVIILRAMFCGSGKITDIRLQRGLSDNLDEKVVEAARKIRFTPAQ